MHKEILNLSAVPILVTGADRFALEFTSKILHGFGAKTLHVAETGQDAKRMIEHAKIELLIGDFSLSDMDGLEFIRWVRGLKEERTRSIPIIALCGYTGLPRIKLALAAGADIILNKPVSPQGLYDSITRITHSSRHTIDTHYHAPSNASAQDTLILTSHSPTPAV
jgi:CheY-like chemotaxis protein